MITEENLVKLYESNFEGVDSFVESLREGSPKDNYHCESFVNIAVKQFKNGKADKVKKALKALKDKISSKVECDHYNKYFLVYCDENNVPTVKKSNMLQLVALTYI